MNHTRTLTVETVREIFVASGYAHAAFCIQQAESEMDRAEWLELGYELDRLHDANADA